MNLLGAPQPAVLATNGSKQPGKPPDHVKRKIPAFPRIIHGIAGYCEIFKVREFGFYDVDACGRCRDCHRSAGINQIPDDGDDPGGMTKPPVKRCNHDFSCRIDRVHECVVSDILIFVKIRLLFIFIGKKPVKFDVYMRHLKLNQIVFASFVIVALAFVSCGTSKNANCGCPNKKGMVGY
jgi:hypothetical protein